MKSIIFIITVCVFLCGCFNQNKPDFIDVSVKDILSDNAVPGQEIYIVETFNESPVEEIEAYLEDGRIFTTVKHYKLSGGSWKTDEYNYKYKLEITGRMNNAAKDSTYVILSNRNDITFDMAWKAFGYSSNSEDYFKPEDAVFVAVG